jgi:hypothetical protein
MAIIKSRYFQEKEYATKEALFDDFRKNIDDIIAFKKSVEQKSYLKGQAITCRTLDPVKLQESTKALSIDPAYYYIAVNSTKILDSHDDLHIDNIWDKSIKEQQGKNYLVADHELTIADTIVRKEDVEMLILTIPFSLLGKDYAGDTQVLIYKVAKDKIIHAKAKEWLESGASIEASVRMQYVTILFAMDSNDPDDITLKRNYDKYYPYIANKADFEYIPYYFIILEAKNVRESSLVLAGSNPATGNINRTQEPDKSTQEDKNKNKPNPQDSSTVSKFKLIHTLI